MFHKCQIELIFSCTLKELGCPAFIWYKESYGNKEKLNEHKYDPYPSHAMASLFRCSKCQKQHLQCTDGRNELFLDYNYVYPIIKKLQKDAEDKEQERLLNINNADYHKVKLLEEELKEKDKIINEKLNKIDVLEEKIKAIIQDNQAKSKVLTEVQAYIQAVKKIKIKDEKVKEILKDIFYEIDMLKMDKKESPIIQPYTEPAYRQNIEKMLDKILA